MLFMKRPIKTFFGSVTIYARRTGSTAIVTGISPSEAETRFLFE